MLQARLLKILSNPTRLALLYMLDSTEFVPFEEIAVALRISKATLSKHISMFREFGLVEIKAEGRHKFARLATGAVREACCAVSKIIEERIRSLGNELDDRKES